MRRPILIGAVAAFAAALSLAGCGSGAVATPLTLSYPSATAGADPLPITLIDQTGIVALITLASEIPAAEGVSAVAGQPEVLRVAWPGGICDDRATLVMNRIGSGYELAIHNHPRFTAGVECDATAVTRAVDLTLTQPLDPAALSLNIQFP